MDINQLYTADAHEAGAECRIVNPADGSDTDCYITVIGIDSKSFRAEQRKRQRKALDAVRSNKPIPDDEFGLLVESCTGWRGFKNDKKEWPFTKKNLMALFENSPLIADQVDKFIADRENFTKG
tara:strand:- start:2017 stop:2388 length:372 start_codon:yes stop_codon:yes gene_type:complete